jgi:hypothetical protein
MTRTVAGAVQPLAEWPRAAACFNVREPTTCSVGSRRHHVLIGCLPEFASRSRTSIDVDSSVITNNTSVTPHLFGIPEFRAA